ncbi:UDP-2,3-diacylglucosamine diphosphatase [Nitrincola tapanii]|uniref:UDP-2,3-diacylglucosamine hydrolase n=1 Tax=Nitrincola tapanii TaxID=1708751 RepID=A0A5A9W5A1_9GAMM|nr:UDP-2,3-diacylglucosamine diphosphatase [Nitrincola tapanii]KAA0875345.1 UDP-2,3-diacylglucosamine diphosphatase [Nitrincola tapanii]
MSDLLPTRLLLISDLHLQPGRPDITQAFLWFLQHKARGADQLLILGDFFEYWIGDDAPLPPADEVSLACRELADSGTKIFFQAGNRDFLIGSDWLAQSAIQPLPELCLWPFPDGQLSLLLHGDQLCTQDLAYQTFRQQVRQPAWQNAFLQRPINERRALAEQLRSESQAQSQYKAEAIMDVELSAVLKALTTAQVDRMIHGHTHRPAHHLLEQQDGSQAERWVLGDWDKLGWYLEANPSGLKLISFDLTCLQPGAQHQTGTPL